jgi:predicted ribosome quality control (RQC) complex YloA/Tae2 family protein
MVTLNQPKMKRYTTSFDIAVLCRELNVKLKDYYVNNIYQTDPYTLLITLNKPGAQPLQLITESGKRIHITTRMVERPKAPSNFCSALRKHLVNGRILKIEQDNFERVVRISIAQREETFQLIIELFSKGNILLTNNEGKILQALTYKRMKDRKILRGEKYQLPPSSGLDPRSITFQQLSRLKESKDEVVKALTRLIAIGGFYAEEILLSAEIDKTLPSQKLTEDQLKKLHQAIRELKEKLDNPRPRIIYDESGSPIDFTPFPLKIYSKNPVKAFPSINETLDEYFTKIAFETGVEELKQKYEAQIAEQQRILNEQTSKLNELEEKISRNQKIGELIYKNISNLQTLTDNIKNKKQSGQNWQQIQIELEKEKKAGKYPQTIFESLNPTNQTLSVKIEGLYFELELKKSIYENASKYYDEAKQMREKLTALKKAIEETNQKINSIRRDETSAISKIEEPAIIRETAWYEKYNFFLSSDGFIVVGGKDASSNEALIKRYTDPDDIVVHTDVTGAPFVIIKTQGKIPSKITLFEAAQFAACHSRAWREQFGSIDVYWVKPNQVTKAAPTGQFLSKGAFMVYGHRNYIRNVPLRLGIGLKTDERTGFIAGPLSALKENVKYRFEIGPGDEKARDLALKIKYMLMGAAPKEIKDKVRKIPIEKLISLIPYGKGKIVSSNIS